MVSLWLAFVQLVAFAFLRPLLTIGLSVLPDMDDHDDAKSLKGLKARLSALEKAQQRNPMSLPFLNHQNNAGMAYQMIAEFLGGGLTGLGLGAICDHFTHRRPLGLIVGLILGLGLALYFIIRKSLVDIRKSDLSSSRQPHLPIVEDDISEDGE